MIFRHVNLKLDRISFFFMHFVMHFTFTLQPKFDTKLKILCQVLALKTANLQRWSWTGHICSSYCPARQVSSCVFQSCDFASTTTSLVTINSLSFTKAAESLRAPLRSAPPAAHLCSPRQSEWTICSLSQKVPAGSSSPGSQTGPGALAAEDWPWYQMTRRHSCELAIWFRWI